MHQAGLSVFWEFKKLATMPNLPDGNLDRLALKLQGLTHEAEQEGAARRFVARRLKKGDRVTVGDVVIEITGGQASLVVHHAVGVTRNIDRCLSASAPEPLTGSIADAAVNEGDSVD